MVEQKKNKFSVTSNNVKLLKHLDALKRIQVGNSSPIMVHLVLTNQCNLNCPTCCFASTNNDGKTLDLEVMKETMGQFRDLGTHAVELTGGGDPTVYPQINDAISYLFDAGYTIGINTNGVLANRIKTWDKISWVRLSMNSLDFFSTEKAHKLAHIRSYVPTPSITGCYVWNEKGEENINRVIDYANKERIITRVVPNCITSPENIMAQLDTIMSLIDKRSDNEYVFASDHNVDVEKRRNNNCYLHHIKPAVFTDGWVYSCPSSELSQENGVMLSPKFRVCYGTDVKEFYTKNFTVSFDRSCNFCKYKKQNELLEDLLTPTIHNEFC
jgi:MoaA/NifB/PqqE/SkfB family radical SAM enzyme